MIGSFGGCFYCIYPLFTLSQVFNSDSFADKTEYLRYNNGLKTASHT